MPEGFLKETDEKNYGNYSFDGGAGKVVDTVNAGMHPPKAFLSMHPQLTESAYESLSVKEGDCVEALPRTGLTPRTPCHGPSVHGISFKEWFERYPEARKRSSSIIRSYLTFERLCPLAIVSLSLEPSHRLLSLNQRQQTWQKLQDAKVAARKEKAKESLAKLRQLGIRRRKQLLAADPPANVPLPKDPPPRANPKGRGAAPPNRAKTPGKGQGKSKPKSRGPQATQAPEPKRSRSRPPATETHAPPPDTVRGGVWAPPPQQPAYPPTQDQWVAARQEMNVQAMPGTQPSPFDVQEMAWRAAGWVSPRTFQAQWHNPGATWGQHGWWPQQPQWPQQHQQQPYYRDA